MALDISEKDEQKIQNLCSLPILFPSPSRMMKFLDQMCMALEIVKV